MKARVLFIATVAALTALALPLFAQAGGDVSGAVSENGVTVTPITPEQALASTQGPNVIFVKPGESASGPSGTTFVQVAPGLTLRQAVGLDPIPASTMAALQARANAVSQNSAMSTASSPNVECSPGTCGGGGSGFCSYGTYTHPWGLFGVPEQLTDQTNWCGDNGLVTLRSSSVYQGGSVCYYLGVGQHPVSGGIGDTWDNWDDTGDWHCPGGDVSQWMEMHVGGGGANQYSFDTSS